MDRALFLLLGLIMGVGVGYLSSSPSLPTLLPTIVLFVILLVFAIKKKQVLPYLAPFAIGFFLGYLHLPISAGRREVTGIVVRAGENYYVVFGEFRRYYVYEAGHGRELGDILRISGNVKEYARASYESRFDFGEYLHSLGVYGEISASSTEAVFSNPIRIRFLENAFLSSLDEHAKGLTGSLLFGRKDYENEVIGLSSSMNLSFALSSSGLLYGMLLRFIEKRLKWKFSDKVAETIMLVISLLFLPFGIAKIGIRRVFLTRLLSFINLYFLENRFDSPTRTCMAGIIIVALNRYDALQSGLWLGLGISLGFSFSSAFIRRFKGLRRYIVRFILLRLFLLPVNLVYGEGEIPLLSGIYSQLLIPISLVYTLFAGTIFILSFASPLLNPVGEGYYQLLKGLSYINPKFAFPPPSTWFLILYYIALVLGLILFEAGFRKTPALLGLGGLLTYLASLAPFPILFTDQVSFINVGQGDSILIRDNNNVVLLDTGGNIGFDMATEVLIPFFRKQRIDHIDYLIASHGDFDHIGAKDSLMENFTVHHFLSSHQDFPLVLGELTFHSLNHFAATEENDKSLVLTLDFMNKKWIFTGDAPERVEKAILAENPDLDCDILKAGHHGSDTSTCAQWLDAITPETVIISCGRNNSYGHPKPSVMSLLFERGINVRRTDREGTITYRSFSLSQL